VCSESKAIKHGSWFQHSNLTFQEALFLTYDIVRREPVHLIEREHRFGSNTIADWDSSAERQFSCTWGAALRRSAVLTRP
jgi:hypothetical protein